MPDHSSEKQDNFLNSSQEEAGAGRSVNDSGGFNILLPIFLLTYVCGSSTAIL